MTVSHLSVCHLFDFTDSAIESRFVTRDHSGLSLPGGYTQFEGISKIKSQGSKLDTKGARLTIGQISFAVTDIDGSFTAWLAEHDREIYRTPVTVKSGIFGAAESTYSTSRWVVEDLRMKASHGGQYEITLTNILSRLMEESPLYQDWGSDGYGELELSTDINTTATTIPTDNTMYWPDSGYAYIETKGNTLMGELIHYSSKDATNLLGVTRNMFGMGSESFWAEEASLHNVWFKRGNPLDIMMEWLTTTDRGDDPGELWQNGDFEDWTSISTPNVWGRGSASVVLLHQEIEYNHGGEISVRAERFTGGYYGLYQYHNNVLTPGKWYLISCYAKSSEAGISNSFRSYFRNSTNAYCYDNITDDWVPGNSNQIWLETASTEWTHYWRWVYIPDDLGFAQGDMYSFGFDGYWNNGESMYYDNVKIFGPFDSEGNGPYDVGDGEGLGDTISYEEIDITAIEEIRDTYYPIPSFYSTGGTDFGSAMFFVERKGVEKIFDFLTKHIINVLGLWPIVTAAEKFSVQMRFRASPVIIDIGNDWNVSNFKASKWRRNWRSALNQIERSAGWFPGSDRYITDDYSDGNVYDDDDSIAYFGERPAENSEGRGYPWTPNIAQDSRWTQSDHEYGISRTLLDGGNPWSPIQVEVFFQYRNLIAIGDTVTLDIPVIPDLVEGVRGINDAEFIVLQKTVKPSSVVLLLKQRRTLYKPGFICENGCTEDFDNATDAEKRYCYLTANDEDTFADGSPSFKIVG